jgi:hypothetical protein
VQILFYFCRQILKAEAGLEAGQKDAITSAVASTHVLSQPSTHLADGNARSSTSLVKLSKKLRCLYGTHLYESKHSDTSSRQVITA